MSWQSTVPEGQPHSPSMQSKPGGHLLSQAPQLFLSVSVSCSGTQKGKWFGARVEFPMATGLTLRQSITIPAGTNRHNLKALANVQLRPDVER